jgi:protease IV
MPLQADHLVDRRRLKRRLAAWRLVTVAAIIAVVILALERVGVLGRDYVARLDIEGIITEDFDRDEALAAIADDRRAKALIVRINSPGGTVVGGEALYRRLRLVSEAKPVVAVMGEVATSAGYLIALGTDHIIGRQGTITGSIGVILQTANITGLLDSLGIKTEAIRSAPLKARPSPLEEMNPEVRVAVERVVQDMYAMFVGIVQERRNLSEEQVRNVSDGRIFTGRQAIENGLIDGIGSEIDARAWLADVHGIDRRLAVRELEDDGTALWVRRRVASVLGKSLLSETLRLDGLVSVWHPQAHSAAGGSPAPF